MADDPTPELARTRSRKGLTRSMTRSRVRTLGSSSKTTALPQEEPEEQDRKSLAEMAPGVLGDQMDVHHRVAGEVPVTGASTDTESIAFHGDQPLLILTDTDGRAEGGEGDGQFAAVVKEKGGDGRTAAYLNSDGTTETIEFDRLSHVALPWDPKLRSAPGILLRDVRVMQHLKARLGAMEQLRAETEVTMGEGAVDNAVSHAAHLEMQVERAEGALENAEKWSKSLKEMRDKEKEREKAAASGDPAAAAASKGKFDSNLMFGGAGGGSNEFQPKFVRKSEEEEKLISLRWVKSDQETRPTQGRELKNATLSKALRRGQMRFGVPELDDFEHHGNVLSPGDVRADDFVLAGTSWFFPAPPAIGLAWAESPEKPAHGRELKNTKASSALSAAIASGTTMFTEDELEDFGLMQKDLRDDDFIFAGNAWFTPAEDSKLKVTEKGRAVLWMHLTGWKAYVDLLALRGIVDDAKRRSLEEGLKPKVKQQVRMVLPMMSEMSEVLKDLGKIDTDLIRLQMLRDISFDELKEREKQLKTVNHWMKTYKSWIESDDESVKAPTPRALENVGKHLEKVYDTFSSLQKLANNVTVDLLEDLAETSLKKCGAAGLRRYHPGQVLSVRKDRQRGARWVEVVVRSSDTNGKHKLKAVNGGFFSNFKLPLHPWNHAPLVLHASNFETLLSWYVGSLAEEHSVVIDPVLGHPMDVLEMCAFTTIKVETSGDKSMDEKMRDVAKKRLEEAEAEKEAEAEAVAKAERLGKPVKPPKKKKKKGLLIDEIIDVTDATTLSTYLRVLHDNLGKGDAIASPAVSEQSDKHLKMLRTPTRSSQIDAPPEPDAKKPSVSYKDDAVGQGTLVLVTGPSSSGKTFLLHQLVMQELERDGNALVSSASELVPIVVRLKLLARKMETDENVFSTAWNWIDAYLRLEYGADSELYLMLRQAMMARRALLLLDGLDEGGDKRMLIERHLVEVVAPQGHVTVLTSRPQGYTDFVFEGFPHLSLQPLTEEQQVEYLAMRLGDNCEGVLNFHADASLERLPDEAPSASGDDEVQQPAIATSEAPMELVTSNPFILLLVASTAIMLQDQGDTMPSTVAEVYGLACTAMIRNVEASDAWSSPPQTPSNLEALIETVFFVGHLAGKREITLVELERAVQLLAPSMEVDALQDLIYAFDGGLVQNAVPLFGVLQDRPLRLEPAHPAIQEYFVAKAIMNKRTALNSPPWKWSIWWSNVVTLGAELGDEFCYGLFHGVGFKDNDSLELELHQKINGHRETVLRAIAQMGRVASFISATKNGIEAREMATLLSGSMPHLKYLELANNQIGLDFYGEPLGARWTKFAKKPALDGGTLMVCEKLSKELQKGKLEFTVEELDEFEIREFAEGNFIKDNRKPPGWYMPSPEILPGPPNEGMPPLADAISQGRLPKLKGLELRGNHISEDAMELLSRAIRNGNTPHLVSIITDKFEVNDERSTYVNFANANLNNEDLSILTELILNGALPHCTMFNLIGNDFTLGAAEQLVEALKTPTFMRWTALQAKPEASSDREIVGDPFLQDSLRSGQLTFSRAEVRRMTDIAGRSWDCFTYAPPAEEVEKTLFGGGGPPVYFQPEQARAIFSLLPQVQLPDAKSLTYRDQMFSDVDAFLLSESIHSARSMDALQSIELDGNRITTKGFTHLVTVLESVEIPNLTTLSLPKNKIDDEGLRTLCVALSQGKFDKLEVLMLQDNAFGDDGVKWLLEAVQKKGALPQIRTLLLGGKKSMSQDTTNRLADIISAVEPVTTPAYGKATGAHKYWTSLNKLSVLDHAGTAVADACVARDIDFVHSDHAFQS